ncbi:venom serine protease [Microplitis demolitor]|uniref:venom serine protease n=1 Tax=Microplitis demolitor TaxID=69319 RepID=UPI0004CD2E5E|nr:venom serine protease [Microplitis demolitor]
MKTTRVCSVISMSLLLILLFSSVLGIINEDFGDCDYEQEIQAGKSYPVFSPNFPYTNYRPGTKCRWTARSNQQIKMTCNTISLPERYGCSLDVLKIQSSSSKPAQRYCGNRPFSVISENNRIVATLSSSSATGGYFYCTLKTVSNGNTNCRCGWKNPTRIAGGEDTGVHEYPMMAEVIDASGGIICGATIVNNKQVITAAHCISGRNYNSVGVLVGDHDLSTRTETTATKLFRVVSFVIHSLYNEHTLDYDIALINIDGTIEISEQVGPVCLPFKHSQSHFQDETVEILGWGSLGPVQSQSNVLQKAQVKVITQQRCANDYPRRIGSRQLCTLENEKDSCQYDSGGPVLWRNPETRRIILVAMIGYGMICTDGRPSVNIRVGAYIDWIVSNKPLGWQYCNVE